MRYNFAIFLLKWQNSANFRPIFDGKYHILVKIINLSLSSVHFQPNKVQLRYIWIQLAEFGLFWPIFDWYDHILVKNNKFSNHIPVESIILTFKTSNLNDDLKFSN